MEDCICKIIDLESEINQDMIQLVELKKDIIGRIVALVREPLDAELKDIEMLENRYAQTIDEMDDEMAATEKELEAMQGELVVG